MAKKVKIVFLGAGSAIFTRRLIADLIKAGDIPPCDVVMHDIDKPVLNYMTRYCQMMVERENAPITVTAEPDRGRAFDGADFVIITLTVGGAQADIVNVEVPLKYGVWQPVGDTVGPGGLMRTFRSYETFKGFVEDMEKYCPHTLVINFSNPMTMLCRMMNRLGKIKTVGLCHGTRGTLKRLGAKLGIDPAEIKVVPAGVNHFIWFLKLTHRGKELYPRLRRELIEKGKGKDDPISTELLRIYGYYPSPGGCHVGEFLPYFLKSEEDIKKYRMFQRDNRANDERRRQARAHCRDVVRGKAELPPLGGADLGHSEGAIPIISSVVNDKGTIEYANIPNRGYISNLPDDAVVEVPTRFGKKGFEGIKVGPLPPGIRAHMMHVIETQELAVEAAITGDYNLALQAFLSDYLINDIPNAEKMLKEMFRRSRKWVGQFHKGKKR